MVPSVVLFMVKTHVAVTHTNIVIGFRLGAF